MYIFYSRISPQGAVILKFYSFPNSHKTLYTSIDALELFSCCLDNEDETALSILDPVSITLEIKPPRDELSGRGPPHQRPRDGDKPQQNEVRGTQQTFEVNVHVCTFLPHFVGGSKAFSRVYTTCYVCRTYCWGISSFYINSQLATILVIGLVA